MLLLLKSDKTCCLVIFKLNAWKTGDRSAVDHHTDTATGLLLVLTSETIFTSYNTLYITVSNTNTNKTHRNRNKQPQTLAPISCCPSHRHSDRPPPHIWDYIYVLHYNTLYITSIKIQTKHKEIQTNSLKCWRWISCCPTQHIATQGPAPSSHLRLRKTHFPPEALHNCCKHKYKHKHTQTQIQIKVLVIHQLLASSQLKMRKMQFFLTTKFVSWGQAEEELIKFCNIDLHPQKLLLCITTESTLCRLEIWL